MEEPSPQTAAVPQSSSPEFLYRFRSARALLEGFNELENQEIYFAPPNELNDPLEGYKEVFWKGDEILWNNLLKHYLLCLLRSLLMAKLTVPGEPFDEVSFVRWTEDALPTKMMKDLYRRIVSFFTAHPDVPGLVASLARRSEPIRSAELTTYLRLLHHHALNSVISVMEEDMPGLFRTGAQEDLLRDKSSKPLPCRMMSEHMEEAEKTPEATPGLAEAISVAEALVGEQQFLLARYSSPDLFSKGMTWHSIFVEFPGRYVIQLDQLLHSNWYTACFVKDPTHAAMWGNYADGHKGICLQFRAVDPRQGSPGLALRRQVGLRTGKSGPEPVYDFVAHKCSEVRYQPNFVQIDFFRSLGTLNRAMMNFWFRNDVGVASARVADILAESQTWRTGYWEDSENTVTTKLSDWSYEAEYRAVLVSMLVDFSQKSDRKLRFKFSDLEGIIFGTRTSTADKLKIMEIVARKCKSEGRSSFRFQQARFSSRTGKFEIAPLDLLNAIFTESEMVPGATSQVPAQPQ